MYGIHIHLSYKKLLENIETARERRLNLEIYFDSHTLDILTEQDLYNLKESLNWNPTLSSHGPFMDMSPGGADEKVRRVTLERFLRLVEIAKVLRPEVLVFHPGYDKWRFYGHERLWLENSIKTWSAVLEQSKDIVSLIAIENVFEEDPSTIEALINGIDSDRFGVCLDIGHFHLFSKRPLKEWIDRLGHRLIEVHIHDNNGREDEHLAMEEGTVDFKTLFNHLNALPGKPLLTIEARGKEEVLKTLERLTKALTAISIP